MLALASIHICSFVERSLFAWLFRKSKWVNGVNADTITFKIGAKGKYYNFSYSLNGKDWIFLKESVDGTFLSTKKARGFVGTIYGMYTTSSGEKSTNKAVYHWFENKNID
jgi:beta-xylosidase